MQRYTSSYLKTTALLTLATIAAVLLANNVGVFTSGVTARALSALLGGFAALLGVVAASGWVVLQRQRRVESGREDLFWHLTQPRREAALAAPNGFRAGPLRRLIARWTLGHDFLAGDEIEILSVPEILATLDERGMRGGIPFQAEMVKFCGARGRVFRSVDKIYDYGRSKKMRRLKHTVLISGLRCDGAQHGGCQALCYLMWNVAWLQTPGAKQRSVSTPAAGEVAASRVSAAAPDAAGAERYLCQFTQLHAASTPVGSWDVRKDLRPWIAGNITLATLCVGLATRAFNFFQGLRGGIGFPAMPLRSDNGAACPISSLSVNDRIKVRPITEIALTLNKSSKNKGLWFDRDMIKHCGTTQRVLARVDKIIDDATGEMRQMKTPCIVLADVDYSGEFLHFNAQHDYFFWREAWLERTTS